MRKGTVKQRLKGVELSIRAMRKFYQSDYHRIYAGAVRRKGLALKNQATIIQRLKRMETGMRFYARLAKLAGVLKRAKKGDQHILTLTKAQRLKLVSWLNRDGRTMRPTCRPCSRTWR